MSRKLRQEQQMILQMKQEAEEEDDKIKQQQEKIFSPITWFTLVNGFRVQDLRDKHYETVLDIIKTDYFKTEVLCRNAEIEEDEISIKSTLAHIMFTMKDSSSIVLIDEKNGNTIAGALLLRVSNKNDLARVFSRVTHTDGEARKKCLLIQTALNRRINLYDIYKCNSFLRYYLLCIRPEYRHRDLGYQLMRAGLDVATSLHLSVVSGIFTNFKMQKLAKRLNFQLLQEVSYTNWRDKHELIFSDPGAGNYSCAIMAAEVPKERLVDPYEFKEENPANLIRPAPPRTRLQKRSNLKPLRDSFLD